MTRYLPAVAALTLVYALALASFHPLDLLFGAGLSAALVFASRRFVFEDHPRSMVPTSSGEPSPSCPLPPGSSSTYSIGTWEVTLVTLHLRPLARGPAS